MVNTKLPYRDSWYERFGPLIVKRGITAIPKALWDYRETLGIGSNLIDLWGVVSAKYRGSRPPTLKIAWIAETVGKKPDTVRKLLEKAEKKKLLKISKKPNGKYEIDLSPTNQRLNSLLTAEQFSKEELNLNNLK
ncbi:MAG: hypothetical protein V1807_01105 [Patescibacteria group bacterium]